MSMERVYRRNLPWLPRHLELEGKAANNRRDIVTFFFETSRERDSEGREPVPSGPFKVCIYAFLLILQCSVFYTNLTPICPGLPLKNYAESLSSGPSWYACGAGFSRTGNRTLEAISLTTDHRACYSTPSVVTVPRIRHRVFSYSVLFVPSRIPLALSQYAK